MKKQIKTITERIMRLVRWYQYDNKGNIIKESDEKLSDSEFSYDDFMNNEFGITFNDDHGRINLRRLYDALQKHKDLIFDSKYDEVYLVVETYDGYFSDAEIIGKRKETQEDIEQRERDKKQAEEQRKFLKERKQKEREEKKLAKLREEMEKYKEKLGFK